MTQKDNGRDDNDGDEVDGNDKISEDEEETQLPDDFERGTPALRAKSMTIIDFLLYL